MNALFHDLRYALRQLRKAPGFTVTAVCTLALGIGANTAIFTLIHGILLRSLPVANPAQLYRIGDTNNCCVDTGFQNSNGDFSIFSYDLYLTLKNAAPEFEQLAAVEAGTRSYSVRRGDAPANSLRGEFVSGNYFATLGLGATAGRVFGESDDRAGATPVVVLNYRAWQTEFGGDPSIVGSTIYIQTKPFTVAGIAPPGFYGDRLSAAPPALWMPLSTEPLVHGGEQTAILHRADSNWLYPLGRVRAGTNIAALQSKLSTVLRQWLTTRPVYTENGLSVEIPKQHVVLEAAGSGIQSMQRNAGNALRILMILASVVLLIACANVANLMLARGAGRRGEIAVRVALGAGRRRVMRQIVTESILLSSMGGLAGLAVAYGGARLILALAYAGAKDMPISSSPSLPVLGFAFLVSLLTGLLFGLAPAWISSRAQPADVLRGSNRGDGAARDRSLLPQKSLVALQAALSLALLAVAMLISRSLVNLERQDLGVATANRYVFNMDPSGAGYTLDRLPALYRQIEDRFSALPGADNVGFALHSPLDNSWGDCVVPQGHSAPGPNDDCNSAWNRASTRLLDSIGIPMVHGRGFNGQDTAASPLVTVVNETFARKFYPNQNPIGKRFGLGDPRYSSTFEIVGVFRDYKINPQYPADPVFLRPFSQQFNGYKDSGNIFAENRSEFAGAVVLSFKRPEPNAEALVRRTMAGIDPNLTVTGFRTMQMQVEDNYGTYRLMSRLTGLFGALALMLASVGLYGVTSYFVASRRSEIGIRMALGATRASVVNAVMRGALWQVLIGLGLGIPAAILAGRLLANELYEVSVYDPLALTGATLLLGLCAAAAGFIPARRAASIDPMQALRTE
ncbi:MAG: ABC transporter permease [Terracidiphilus sp.]|jgi:predicted permease